LYIVVFCHSPAGTFSFSPPQLSLRIPIIFGDSTHRTSAEIIIENGQKHFIYYNSLTLLNVSLLDVRMKNYEVIDAKVKQNQADSFNCTGRNRPSAPIMQPAANQFFQ
jgi:hypothetical protein